MLNSGISETTKIVVVVENPFCDSIEMEDVHFRTKLFFSSRSPKGGEIHRDSKFTTHRD
jgi:hypothetical protein